MAWKGYQKGWVALLVASALLAGCGANTANTQEAPANQPSSAVESASGGQGDSAANAGKNEEAAEEQTTRVVTDQFGEVEIPVHPKRVSALYREDYLVALGVTPIVQYYNPMWGKQDYLELEVPLFDVTGSIEAMLVSEPDLIIAAGEVDAAAYELYSKVAPTYRLPDDVLADTRTTLKVIADLLGIPGKAEQVLKDYESRISEVKTKVQASLGDEKLVVLRMNVVDQSINIFGMNNTFVGQILYKDLGLKAPAYAETMTEGNVVLSQEVIPELDADHIIMLPSNGTWEDEDNAKALKAMLASPLWKSVPAVKNGHVYQVERSYWQTGAITANFKKMDELLKLLVE
ncbi:ferrichrome ABC transporter substrate-binding protein [Paenibacillus sp. BIHB 4019]|uniref:Ferrichrome ABC transporter substrate-binding protein n=1 Tax=Paenibacillus sp. BIHB 4019 TaxID=1870819 RepID=A0A1B2DDV7_9BACL|nr:ABC transporter substrate-binding protein [Paenibacillus sp. BIHB 4019]ANY65901.1 ferrichrome ABC transporter substrate-binding protein [Paenibacillus sp. BIHB 4019]